MPIAFSSRVVVRDDVLIRELDGEAVLLSLITESYHGLDDVGTRMWNVMTTADSLEEAFETLLAEYDVEPEQLRQDIQHLVTDLVKNGLVTVKDLPVR